MELFRKLTSSRMSRVGWGLAIVALAGVMALSFVFAYSSVGDQQRAAQARAVGDTTKKPLSDLTATQVSKPIVGEAYKAILKDVKDHVMNDDRVLRVRIFNLSGTLVFSTDADDKIGVAQIDSPQFRTGSLGGVASVIVEPQAAPTSGLAGSNDRLYVTFAALRLESQPKAAAVVEVDHRYSAIKAAAYQLWRPVQLVIGLLILAALLMLVLSFQAWRAAQRFEVPPEVVPQPAPGFAQSGSSRVQKELEKRLEAVEESLRTAEQRVAASEREKRQIAERLVAAHEQLELMTAAAKSPKPVKGGDEAVARRVATLEAERDRMAAEVSRLETELEERRSAPAGNGDGESSKADKKAQARLEELEAALTDANAKAASLESAARQFEEERKTASAELDRARDEIASQKARTVARSRDAGSLAEAAAQMAKAEERAKHAEELVMKAEARAKQATEELAKAEERAQKAEDRTRKAEEQSGYADERLKLTEERARQAEDLTRQAEEKGRQAEDKARQTDEKVAQALERAGLLEEQARVFEEQARHSGEQARQAQDRASEFDQRATKATEELVQTKAKADEQLAQEKAKADEQLAKEKAKADEQLAQANVRMENLQTGSLEVERRAVSAEQRVAQLETVTKQAEERMTQLEGGQRQAEQRAAQSDARLREVEAERTKLSVELERITEALAAKEKELTAKAEREGRAEQAEGRLRAVEEERARLAGELDRVLAAGSPAAEAGDDGGRAAQLAAKVEELEAQRRQDASELQRAEKERARLAEELERAIAGAQAAPAAKGGMTSELAARVEELEAQRRRDVSDLQHFQEALANTQHELAAATKRAKQAESSARKLQAVEDTPDGSAERAGDEDAQASRPERRSRSAKAAEELFAQSDEDTIATRLSRAKGRKGADDTVEAEEKAEEPAAAAPSGGLSLRERLARAAAARHRAPGTGDEAQER